MGHRHSHSAAAANKHRLAIVFGLTSTYLIAEVIGGLLTGSLALLADAGHMLTDVAGLGLALMAIKFAERPATPERTYGYYRVEILAALTNAVVLIGISLYILYEAWERFRRTSRHRYRMTTSADRRRRALQSSSTATISAHHAATRIAISRRC